MSEQYTRPAPPPPIFLGQKERDLVKQVNDELIERVIGQPIMYYPISLLHTNFHPTYGEAIHKTFLPPIRVYCLVNWEGLETVFVSGKYEKLPSIIIHFHKRRLSEDQDLVVKEGDFVQYNETIYEIIKTNEPKSIFGQNQHRMEVEAKCIKARETNFDNSGIVS